MAKTFLKVVIAIVSAVIAYFLLGFCQDLSSNFCPRDDLFFALGAGGAIFIALFACFYFLTKGGGGGGD